MRELHELTGILVTQISVTLATYIPTINLTSTERNMFPHFLLHSTETFIQDLSTTLYIVLSHGTVDAVFLTKLSATLFQRCIQFESIANTHSLLHCTNFTCRLKPPTFQHLALITSGDNATNMWACIPT